MDTKRRYCIFKIRWRVYIYGAVILFLVCLTQCINSEGCTLRSDKKKEDEQRLLKRLEPLKGKVFNVTEKDKEGKEKYVYSIGICITVDDRKPLSGAIQYEGNANHTLGMINSTEVLGGDIWISLQYGEGESYAHYCSQKPRLTNIMIICDEYATTEKLNFVEERNEESVLCYYLFELNTNAICPEKKKLSTGSVICLIIIPCCGIYLLLGFLYRRVVVGAKGLEQIPNYAFWQDFGNLQADGCDFICRCGSRQQSQAYRGIDDCLDREEEERDDQLLAM